MDLLRLRGEPWLDSSFPLPLDRPFTSQTARQEAGLRYTDLRWLVQQGFLRRPIRGVYVASQVPDALHLRCECLRLVAPPDAVVCDRHAGWLHGAEMVLAPNEHLDLAPVTMYLPPGRRMRNPIADGGERQLRPNDVIELHGVLVTTPLRTTWDLGRTRWPERSLSAMDQMLRLGRFTTAELVAGVERFRGMRWVTTLRLMVGYVDGRAESPPESILRLRWIEAHLPAPVPQYEVWVDGRFLARLDLGNPDLRFAAEYDGAEWHSSPEQQEHDRARRAAVEERADWLVQPFTKENLFGHRQDADRLLLDGAARARRRSRRTL